MWWGGVRCVPRIGGQCASCKLLLDAPGLLVSARSAWVQPLHPLLPRLAIKAIQRLLTHPLPIHKTQLEPQGVLQSGLIGWDLQRRDESLAVPTFQALSPCHCEVASVALCRPMQQQRRGCICVEFVYPVYHPWGPLLNQPALRVSCVSLSTDMGMLRLCC